MISEVRGTYEIVHWLRYKLCFNRLVVWFHKVERIVRKYSVLGKPRITQHVLQNSHSVDALQLIRYLANNKILKILWNFKITTKVSSLASCTVS